jgi:hypothetical protein
MSDDRIVNPGRGEEDAQYEAGLRPRTLDEYIGQNGYVNNSMSLFRPPGSVAKRSTTCCSMVRRASARPLSPL